MPHFIIPKIGSWTSGRGIWITAVDRFVGKQITQGIQGSFCFTL
jgi:hypothetical protein